SLPSPRRFLNTRCSFSDSVSNISFQYKGKLGRGLLVPVDPYDSDCFTSLGVHLNKDAVELAVLLFRFEFFRYGGKKSPDHIFLDDADNRVERSGHADVRLKRS